MNLVEIDLLCAGERLPLLAPLPPGDYYAFVWLTGRQCDVYAWSIRQPLPTIPVPLKEEDGAVGLDLAFSRVYERGRYDRLLRYDEPLDLLSPPDRQCASQRLSENVR